MLSTRSRKKKKGTKALGRKVALWQDGKRIVGKIMIREEEENDGAAWYYIKTDSVPKDDCLYSPYTVEMLTNNYEKPTYFISTEYLSLKEKPHLYLVSEWQMEEATYVSS